MNEQTTNRNVVLNILRETTRVLERDQPKTRGAAVQRLDLRSPKQWATQRDEIVGRLQRAQEWAEADQTIKTARAATSALVEEPVYLPSGASFAIMWASIRRTAFTTRSGKRHPICGQSKRSRLRKRRCFPACAWAVFIIATPGVKQRRRFAPVVFALEICHPERWKQLASDQESASGVTERRIRRGGRDAF